MVRWSINYWRLWKFKGKPQRLCVEAQTCNSTDNSRQKADSSRSVCARERVCLSICVSALKIKSTFSYSDLHKKRTWKLTRHTLDLTPFAPKFDKFAGLVRNVVVVVVTVTASCCFNTASVWFIDQKTKSWEKKRTLQKQCQWKNIWHFRCSNACLKKHPLKTFATLVKMDPFCRLSCVWDVAQLAACPY